ALLQAKGDVLRDCLALHPAARSSRVPGAHVSDPRCLRYSPLQTPLVAARAIVPAPVVRDADQAHGAPSAHPNVGTGDGTARLALRGGAVLRPTAGRAAVPTPVFCVVRIRGEPADLLLFGAPGQDLIAQRQGTA